MVVEVVAGVLIGLLAVATLVAAYLGILGLARAGNPTWCPFCRRIELRPGSAADRCLHAGETAHQSALGLHAHLHFPRAVLHRHQ